MRQHRHLRRLRRGQVIVCLEADALPQIDDQLPCRLALELKNGHWECPEHGAVSLGLLIDFDRSPYREGLIALGGGEQLAVARSG